MFELCYLISDSLSMFFGWTPRWLSLWSNGRVNIQMMTNEIWIYPRVLYAFHVNTSTFFLRNSTNCSLSNRGSWAPTWKNLSESSPTTTFSRSSHFTSSAGLLKRDVRVFDFYESFSVVAEVSASGQCRIAATRHFLVIDWLPNISSTWSPEGYFTF